MNSDVDALLEKARRSLANARLSSEAGDHDFAAARAYYAMFYAAEAALLSRALSFSKHAAVIAEFIRLFVRTGEFAQAHAEALRDGFEERLVADYHFSAPFPEQKARRLIERAAAFVADAEAYLRRQGL